MQINTSTNYAIHMMLYMAKKKSIVPSAELSKNVAVSKRYLMQIAGKLRDGKLVGVSMGPSGGYYLLKEPSQINVYDIIVLMEGDIRILNTGVDAKKHHTLTSAFSDLQQRFSSYLNTLTLDLLVNKSWHECRKVIAEVMDPYNN